MMPGGGETVVYQSDPRGTEEQGVRGAGVHGYVTGKVAPRRGELGGNRTHDPRIKSALLYRLSYELISA